MTEVFQFELREILNKVVKGTIQDFSIDIENIADQAGGFTGDIFFVTLSKKDTLEKQCVVLKQQKGANGQPFDYTIPFFENEIQFYSRILPELQQFYRDVTGKIFDKVPICHVTSNGPNKRLVLENLLNEKFEGYDKTKFFDEAHFEMIFETYGLYHAISMAFREKKAEKYSILENVLEPMWKTTFQTGSFMSTVLVMTCTEVQKFFEDETEKPLLNKLRLYERQGPEILNDCLWQGRTHCVFIHGDCWSNNLMFKYDVSLN